MSQTIATRIKLGRTLKDWSQAKLAEEIEVVVQQVSKYERGADYPTMKRLEKIAEKLEKPMLWFFLEPHQVYLDYPEPLQEEFWQKVEELDTYYAGLAEGVPMDANLRHSSGIDIDKIEDLESNLKRSDRAQIEDFLMDRDDRIRKSLAKAEEEAVVELAQDEDEEPLSPEYVAQTLGKLETQVAELAQAIAHLKAEARPQQGPKDRLVEQISRSDRAHPLAAYHKEQAEAGELRHPLAADGGASKKGKAAKAEERARKLLEEQ